MADLDDFLAATGGTNLEPATNDSVGTTADTKFMNKQFSLFRLPVLTLYLKGAMPSLGPDPTLPDSLELSLIRPLGGAKHTRLFNDLSSELTPANRRLLYTKEGKDFHLTLIEACLDYGLTIDKDACLSRALALETVLDFLRAREAHFKRLGYSSLADWLASMATGSDRSTKITNLDSIGDLDWG